MLSFDIEVDLGTQIEQQIHDSRRP